MNHFSIAFMNTDRQARHEHRWVELQLGNEVECWDAYLGHWSQVDYESQWSNALHRFVKGYTSKEVLVSYFCKDRYHLISCWAMYRFKSTVRFQNHHYPKPARRLRPNHPKIITMAHDYEGLNRASEWEVPFADVAAFTHQINQD